MPNDFYTNTYNPDVLSCLANLSNDEVFTPPEIANQLLDLLPQELFANPDAKFLDPACKSGVFLREIAKRLLKGLEPVIPDLQQRIDHIFQHQLYGIAITELTSLLSRRGVYCSKYPNSKYSVTGFNDAEGNIRFKRVQHNWKDGRCVFCGASQSLYDRGLTLETHAYELIHLIRPEEVFNMKFDVIIGNPPYQLNDGGSGTGISAKPLYHLFVDQAKKLKPRYLLMIIPARWYAGGKGLDEFRKSMLFDDHITNLVDFPKSRDCFPGVDIAGGVCYFLWERDKSSLCSITSVVNETRSYSVRKLNEFDIFVRSNIGVDVIHKVRSFDEGNMSSIVLSRNPFGFISSERGSSKKNSDSITLVSSAGEGFISRDAVTKNPQLIEEFKLIIGKVNPDRGGVNNASDGKMNVTTKISILGPNEVCTETYLVLNHFMKKDETENCLLYFKTQFVRFLISLTLSSMNITKENFCFVPVQDFSKPWTDEELYAKYGLTDEEITFIESMIRPMDLNAGQDDAD